MDIRTTLRETIAEIFQSDPAEIGPGFPLRTRRFEGSVGGGILDAALRRRLGVVCPEVYSVRTYGELEAAVTGESVPAAESPAAREVPASDPPPDAAANGVACGVDIEMVENLPLSEDYWEADFYRTFFTKAEIAYCLEQDDPRMHLAARWCAKEALKKCDPSFLEVEMNQIEVVLDGSRRPRLQIRSPRGERMLPVALSMTHTPVVAAAIVVQVPVAPS